MNPSTATDAPRRRFAAWSIPRDIIIAPARAYASLAAKPAWLPAYAIILVSVLISVALIAPAFVHLIATVYPNAGVAHTPAARADANRSLLVQVALQQSVIVPFVTIGLTATTLTVVARLKGRPTTYAAYFALMANCLVPTAIGTLVSALGVRLHDPASFHDWRAVAIAVPDNLALFANAKNEREVLFLRHFDIFNLWSYLLLAFGIVALTTVRLTTALALAFGLDVCLALLL